MLQLILLLPALERLREPNGWWAPLVALLLGGAMLGLGIATALIDGLGWKRWATPGLIFGANAITALTDGSVR